MTWFLSIYFSDMPRESTTWHADNGRPIYKHFEFSMVGWSFTHRNSFISISSFIPNFCANYTNFEFVLGSWVYKKTSDTYVGVIKIVLIPIWVEILFFYIKFYSECSVSKSCINSCTLFRWPRRWSHLYSRCRLGKPYTRQYWQSHRSQQSYSASTL